MKKIQAGKKMIKDADYIYQIDLSKLDINELYEADLEEDELKRIINIYATKYAQICEYYLKALILPDMSTSAYSENSEEEAQFLINDKNGIRKFNHIFTRIFNHQDFDPRIRNNINSYLLNRLPHIESDRKKALQRICLQDNIPDVTQYNNLRMVVFPKYSSNQDVIQMLDKITGENGLLSDNSDAYPLSRYAMLTDYIADLKFLSIFANALRNSIKLKYKNCLALDGIIRFVFPDLDSWITITFENGNESKIYLDNESKFWITDEEGKTEDVIGHVHSFDNITNTIQKIVKVRYIEDGEEKNLQKNSGDNDYRFIKVDRQLNDTRNYDGGHHL